MNRTTRAAIASLSLLAAASAAHGAGGLELLETGAQAPLLSKTDLFASALHAAWAQAIPGFCQSFSGTFQSVSQGRVAGCDNVPLDVTSSFEPAGSNSAQLLTTLPKIVVHLSWVQANKTVCNADVTLRAGFLFPLLLVTSADRRYSGDGVVQQVDFGPPVLTFMLTDNQLVWHTCANPPLYTASALTVPLQAALNDALSNLGFPGDVVRTAFNPYTAEIQSTISMHSYTVAATGGDLVFTAGRSQLSDVKVGSLPAAVVKTAGTGGWGTASGGAVGAPAAAQAAPSWSTPGGTAQSTAPAGAGGSLRTSHPFTPVTTGQAPTAPSALGSH